MLDLAGSRLLDSGTEARIEDLAEHLNVSVKTLYNNFGNKRSLLKAVIEHRFNQVFAEFEAILEEPGLCFADRSQKLLARALERIEARQGGGISLLGMARPHIRPIVLPLIRSRFPALFARLAEMGRATGEIRADLDFVVVPITMTYLVEGLLEHVVQPQPKEDSKRIVAASIDTILRGLLSPEASEARSKPGAAPHGCADV